MEAIASFFFFYYSYNYFKCLAARERICLLEETNSEGIQERRGNGLQETGCARRRCHCGVDVVVVVAARCRKTSGKQGLKRLSWEGDLAEMRYHRAIVRRLEDKGGRKHEHVGRRAFVGHHKRRRGRRDGDTGKKVVV